MTIEALIQQTTLIWNDRWWMLRWTSPSTAVSVLPLGQTVSHCIFLVSCWIYLLSHCFYLLSHSVWHKEWQCCNVLRYTVNSYTSKNCNASHQLKPIAVVHQFQKTQKIFWLTMINHWHSLHHFFRAVLASWWSKSDQPEHMAEVQISLVKTSQNKLQATQVRNYDSLADGGEV